jgi:xylan 1,4-beta-xylosidase
LRLYGRETIGSLFRQALVARRQQAHCYSAVTRMEFEPQHFQQMAGLVCYYNSAKFHYLARVARRRRYASARDVGAARSGERRRVHRADPDSGVSPIELRVEVDYERLRFAYRWPGG